MVFEANTHNKTEHTMWKDMENCARKFLVYHFVWGHLGVLKDVRMSPRVKQKGVFRKVMEFIFRWPNQITFYSELVHNTDGNELKCI